MLISIMSPSRRAASGPPVAASGQTCPMQGPRNGICQAHSNQNSSWQGELSHPWSSARPFIAHDQYIPWMNPPLKQTLLDILFPIKYPRWSCMTYHSRGNPANFDDSPFWSQIAPEHCNPTCRGQRSIQRSYNIGVSNLGTGSYLRQCASISSGDIQVQKWCQSFQEGWNSTSTPEVGDSIIASGVPARPILQASVQHCISGTANGLHYPYKVPKRRRCHNVAESNVTLHTLHHMPSCGIGQVHQSPEW